MNILISDEVIDLSLLSSALRRLVTIFMFI